MDNVQNRFLSIEQLHDTYLGNRKKNDIHPEQGITSFEDILKSKDEVKFSKHATGRLATRQIELDEGQVARIADGMQRADAKGIRDSLVIMDQLAFIVNVPSKTVITAMDQEETKENIFTNIDGAVIV